jgi:hypothetical protein
LFVGFYNRIVETKKEEKKEKVIFSSSLDNGVNNK